MTKCPFIHIKRRVHTYIESLADKLSYCEASGSAKLTLAVLPFVQYASRVLILYGKPEIVIEK